MMGFEQGRDTLGKVASFMVVDGSCSNQLRSGSYESTTQDKLCHHVPGMEQFAD
jgi:hypothetical protein